MLKWACSALTDIFVYFDEQLQMFICDIYRNDKKLKYFFI